ncbi:MAG: hypothetical protein RLZZ385_1369 [Pseudomonadota bacterium]|jgi:folate-binding protein YgfZ
MPSSHLELPSSDLLNVSGPEHRRFLQGQVTCDMNLLSGSQSLVGALCNIKGRVIADFRAVDVAGDTYLQLSTGLGTIVQTVLARYIVFFKNCGLAESRRFRRHGLLGHDAHHLIQTALGDCPMADHGTLSQDDVLIIKQPGLVPRFEIWCDLENPGAKAQILLNAMQENCDVCRWQEWQVEDFNAGQVHVLPEDSEHYLPQELNYDISGVVNFKKGCYTGQEIVARMFYRGTAKKRLFHLSCSTPVSTSPAQVYLPAPDAGAGASACPVVRYLDTGLGIHHLLAILPVEPATAGQVFYLDSACTQPLVVEPLSYGVVP